jgi:hypothetical protein
VPFRVAPTYGMRELHRSSGIRCGLRWGRFASDGGYSWLTELGGASPVRAAPVFMVIAPVRSAIGSELSFAGGDGTVCAGPCSWPFGLRRVARASERRGFKRRGSGPRQGRRSMLQRRGHQRVSRPSPQSRILVSGVGTAAIWVSVWAEPPRSNHGGPRVDRFSRELVGGGDGPYRSSPRVGS